MPVPFSLSSSHLLFEMAPAPGNAICNMDCCTGNCIEGALAKKNTPLLYLFLPFSLPPGWLCTSPFLWTLTLPIVALCSGWQSLASLLQEAGGWGRNGAFSRARLCALSCTPHAQLGIVPLPAQSVLSQGGSEITHGYFQYTQKPPCKTSAPCLHIQLCN